LTLEKSLTSSISLEVAEHLPESSAESFVGSLVKHGDTIIFSAALPNQGGQNHLNEQWKQYWIDLFGKYNYKVYDLIRPLIWEMPEVDYWYKQNMLVFSKLDLSFVETYQKPIIETIHPEMFIEKIEWFTNYINDMHKQISLLEDKIVK